MLTPPTLGKRIQAARVARGLDQSSLAAVAEVHPKTVSRWENDRQEPDGPALEAIAELLDVTVSWLRRGDEEARGGSAEAHSKDGTVILGGMSGGGRLSIRGLGQPGEDRPASVNWPQLARVFVQRFQLEAAEMGASDDDLDFIRRVLTSPDAYVVYLGGRGRPMTDAELVVEMAGLAEGLRAWLREVLRRRSGQ